MKKYLILLSSILVIAGCGSFYGAEDIEESWINEPTDKFYLALGGVYPGRDELIIYDDAGEPEVFLKDELLCEANGDIVELLPREGFESFSEGSGVLIVPKKVGHTVITCEVGGMPTGKTYGVVVPPQELIQILLAEAGTQIKDEAVYNVDTGLVSLDSKSPTAEALAFVIRNRVNLARTDYRPSTFMADDELFDTNPPQSNYTAIIEASNQFEPVDNPESYYYKATTRENLDSRDWRVAYDQAVLSAGQVFVGDLIDPTCGDKESSYEPNCGAFGFRSPNPDEWKLLEDALFDESIDLPEGCGTSDSNFTAFKPVQVLILPDVWTYVDDDDRPSFVFIRRKGGTEVAVTDTP